MSTHGRQGLHIKTLARKLVQAKNEGERLKAVEEESRRLLLEFKREAIERALSLVIERVRGPRWQRRGKKIIAWNCRVCGSRWASRVRRNGHCRRHLAAGEGDIEIRVPQVECKGYARGISIAGGLLKPRSSYWIELDLRVTELYMSGVSHRKVVEILARRIQSSLSPMTSWRSLQRVGERVRERQEAPHHKVTMVALDDITHRVRGRRRYTLAAQDAERGEWLAMRVSQSRDEEAWVTLLDELWEMEIYPDSGVEWQVCDGDMAIEAAVEIAYPGVKTQRCIWHLLKNAREVLERRYPGQGNAEYRDHLMGMIRGVFATTSEMEAHAGF